MERERQRRRQKEKQAPCEEPNMGLDSRTPGSRPEPKADAQPLSHPGVPSPFWNGRFGLSSTYQQKFVLLPKPSVNQKWLYPCYIPLPPPDPDIVWHRSTSMSPLTASAAWCSINSTVSLCPEAQKPRGLTTSWGLLPVCREPLASRAGDFCTSSFFSPQQIK